MSKSLPLAAIVFALVLPATAADEPHGAVTAFKDFVAAVKAKDGGKAGRFISPHHWAALVKSGKKDEVIPKMIAAADKEGATFSFEEREGSDLFLAGDIMIKPDGVRVPVRKGGDPWTLDIEKLVGKVEVKAEEKNAYLKIGQLVMILNSYKDSVGRYPSTEQGLQALMVKPTTNPVPARWFRMLREIPKDPWGNDFVYTSTGDGIMVRSLGPDAKESDDDLVNPF